MYKYNKKVLDNGLKIIAHKMPQRESVALGVWIASGGRYESVTDRGVNHFIEHLLFKGTKKRTAVQIKNSIEGIGGALNGFTSEEVTCYLVKVLSDHLELGLDVLADMVLNALFAPKDIEMERFVILEEIKMYKDHPDQYVGELLGELLWPNQTLGIPLIGTYDIIKSLKREDIVKCKDKTYNPSNITIVACGDVDWDVLLEGCEKIFSKEKKGSTYNYEKMKVSQARPKANIVYKETEQTHIAMGFHSLSRLSPARYAMDLLNIVLGANMSSRLFHELREKRGLAYAIHSHATYYTDGGAAAIEAGVDNKKISTAVELILKELAKIKEKPITKEEFRRAKEYYEGHLSFVLEDTADHMLWLGKKIVTADEPVDAQEILRRVRSVTIEDILKVAAETFRKENLNIAVIGPTKDKEKAAIKELSKGL